MHNNGLLIALEDISEKYAAVQIKLLTERLKNSGYEVSVYNFPRYQEESSFFVRQLESGKYHIEDFNPYIPPLLGSFDFFDAKNEIINDLNQNKIVICNKYIAHNIAKNSKPFTEESNRITYLEWMNSLNFEMLNIPNADMTVVLSTSNINEESYILETYKVLSTDEQNSLLIVNCLNNNEVMGIPTINNMIWERISPMLKKLRKNKTEATESSAAEVFAPKKTENPYIKQNENGSYTITKEGKQWLEDAVTNTEGNVYATKSKLENVTAAAAMARLSRRGDDMRVIILDEFASSVDDDENLNTAQDLLKRVITAYGDDSVQQLIGQHVVIEGASNLLTKTIERGRLASYLEQSTRYIFFDQKDENGRFKYYTPTNFDEKTKTHYIKQMDSLFNMYSDLVRKLTEYVRSTSSEPEESRDGAWKAATRAQACDAVRTVLPVATKSTVGIFASGQALESLIMHLQSDEMNEARITGESLLKEARKVVPTFLERADKPDRGGAWIAYRAQTKEKLAELASKKNLQPMKGDGDEPVKLTNFWPKNEMDVLLHMLYEQSTLSLEEIEQAVSSWSYDEKEEVVKTYIGERLNRRHKPGRALETVHYNFDLVCDYGIFRDLQRHRMVDSLEWQALTPHYGYDIPKLVTEAGLDDLFEQCFDLSAELYHFLLANDYIVEAQYATLLGHKMRWKMMLNAREAYHFMELRTSPQGHPGYRKLTKQMYDKIAEVHPLIAGGMIFVNKGEDPELTRLAAERATQFKLDQMK